MDRAATMLDLMMGETDPKKKPRKKYMSNGVEINQFKDAIIAPENSGKRNYVAMNPESSATGAYQILYNPMKDELATKYGVRSRQDFANNPSVQEEVMDQLTIKYALDAIDLEKEYAPQLGDKMPKQHEVMALIHYLGRGRTREYLGYVLRDGKDEMSVMPAYVANMPPSKYLELFNQSYQQ